MKKHFSPWILNGFVPVIMLWFMLMPAVSAGPFAVFYFDTEDPSNMALDDVRVVLDDYYHQPDLREQIDGGTDYLLLFRDDKGTIQTYSRMMSRKTVISYPLLSKATKIEVTDGTASYFSQRISFCDYDSVCEPCSATGCTVAENSLTCPDCPTGSSDEYCDLVVDGICDPDCDNDDSDCAGCDPYCFKAGMQGPLFCADYGGDICSDDETCEGDRLFVDTLDADKGDSCCVGDVECIPMTQGDDVPDEVFSGSYGDEVLSEEEMFELEYQAILKSGRPFDEEGLTYEEQLELHEGYGLDTQHVATMTDEDWERIADEDMSFPAEPEPVETLNFREKVREQVQNAADAIEDMPEQTSSVFMIALGVIIVLTLALVAVIFAFKPKKGEKKQGPSKEEVSSKIQPEISSLLKRGYTYDQIKTVLMNKGYDMITVNTEIAAHYQRTMMDYGKKQ